MLPRSGKAIEHGSCGRNTICVLEPVSQRKFFCKAFGSQHTDVSSSDGEAGSIELNDRFEAANGTPAIVGEVLTSEPVFPLQDISSSSEDHGSLVSSSTHQ